MVALPNYTQVPNEFLDARMAELSSSAFKVLMAICRKTFGFHKEQLRDRISFSQLRKITGIASNQTIWKAIEELKDDVNKHVIDGHTFFEINATASMQQYYGDTKIDTVTESVTPLYNNCKGTVTETVNTKETVKETSKEINTSASTDKNRSMPKPVSYDFTTGLFRGVTDEMVATWQAMCPAINVDREIIKAAQWLLANPAKRKKNYRKFLVNWILRSQERGRG